MVYDTERESGKERRTKGEGRNGWMRIQNKKRGKREGRMDDDVL